MSQEDVSLVRPKTVISETGLYNLDFSDIYFNPQDPQAEARHVFVEGNGLTKRWADLGENQSFVIAETGFGAGLNFFVTLKHWLAMRLPDQRLHYISVEQHPLAFQTILDFYRRVLPDYVELVEILGGAYPPLIPGPHLIRLPQWGVTLTLIWSDATQGFSKLRFKADAWYLDGFSPNLNPSLWSPNLFDQVAQHSNAGATLATFSVAAVVRRGLQQVGFILAKRAGFGKKREMLVGEIQPPEWVGPEAYVKKDRPWFIPPFVSPVLGVNKNRRQHDVMSGSPRVAVVGAGLCGSALALRLVQLGAQVTLFDRHARVAQEASGNDHAILFYRPSVDLNIQDQIHRQAYLTSLRELAAAPDKSGFTPCGVLQLAHTEQERQHQQKVMENPPLPSDWLQRVNAEVASELAGVKLQQGGLFFSKSGSFKPRLLCDWRLTQALTHEQMQWNLGQTITDIAFESGTGWAVKAQSSSGMQSLHSGFDHLVLATGPWVNQLDAGFNFPLRVVRGQVTQLAAAADLPMPKVVLCYDGYALTDTTSNRGPVLTIGATFAPGDWSAEVRQEDHDTNLGKFARACMPKMKDGNQYSQFLAAIYQGRAGLRAQLPDYLPLVGPVPDTYQYRRLYKSINKPRVCVGAARYMPGLWVCTGFGAKGGTLSALMAELMCHYILGVPAPLDEDMRWALHPGRFLIRDLKRGGSP